MTGPDRLDTMTTEHPRTEIHPEEISEEPTVNTFSFHRICLVLKHLGSYVVQTFVHIFALYGGVGVKRISE